MSSRLASSASPVGAPLGLVNLNPATVPLYVQAAPSQSSSLQEWRSSTGSVLAKVDASGNVTSPQFTFDSFNYINTVNLFPMKISTFHGLTIVQHSSATSNALQVQGGSPGQVTCLITSATSQTADLLQAGDSAAHTQFAIMNAGTGAAPIWALRVRAIANAESMAQTHATLGAYSGKAIQVFDDAGLSLGWLPLYG